MTIVAIPAFNEEIAIGSVIARARQHVDKVLVIDDGSADNTCLVAELMGATVLRHSKNAGKGMALRTAFKFSGQEIPTLRYHIEGYAFNPLEKGLSFLHTMIRYYYRMFSFQQRGRLFQLTGGDEKCQL
jgi:hypothetical protein